MRSAAALSAVSCLLLAGCGGSGERASPSDGLLGGSKTLEQLWRAPGDDVAVLPGTSEYEPGDVRVSFLVLDAEGHPVLRPSARVFLARGLDAKPFDIARARLERVGVPGGAKADSTHIYVAHVRLADPGRYWFLAEPDGGSKKVQAMGNIAVARNGSTPGIGERAPASRTPTLATVGGDASKLTTRTPPDESLLRHSVAESLRAHVPFVVTFATPKFCQSRTCGPVVDVVEEVARRLEKTGIRFIHVEVFRENDPAKGVNRWMEEWRLQTEPWTFVVDRKGKIAARFEGALSVDELERSARSLVG
jgi:hypothetical protein